LFGGIEYSTCQVSFKNWEVVCAGFDLLNLWVGTLRLEDMKEFKNPLKEGNIRC